MTPLPLPGETLALVLFNGAECSPLFVALVATGIGVLGVFLGRISLTRRPAGLTPGLPAAGQRPGGARAEADTPASLRDFRIQSDDLAQALAHTAGDLAELNGRYVQWQERAEGFARHCLRQAQNEAEQQLRTAGELALALDHLETLVGRSAAGSEARQTAEFAHRRLRRILEEAGVEEIQAAAGDVFDGDGHTPVGQRPDPRPRGTIVEVARKGYRQRRGVRVVVVRPAEVVISAGASAGSLDDGGKMAAEATVPASVGKDAGKALVSHPGSADAKD